jgi:phage terminase large subunit
VVKQDGDMLVRRVSWQDNPFFPEVLNIERLRLKSNDPEAYQHVWEGEPDTRRSGSIYAALIDKARANNRFMQIPYKAGVPVTAAWDLGKRHGTVIWFSQVVGRETRVFDYHEAYGNDADIEKLADAVNKRDYLSCTHYLPHDAKHERLGMKGSIHDQLKQAGLLVKMLPNLSIEAGISKGKALLKECYFDTEATKNGIHAMQHYHYEFDEARQCFKNSPYDDWSADASDAFRYLAIALEQRPQVNPVMSRTITRPVEWSVF